MKQILLALVLAAGIMLTALVLFVIRHQYSRRHKRNIATAWRVYDRLNAIAQEKPTNETEHRWFFSYLRQVDPFVFEELVLIALRNKGFRISRNRRYTGDGGIDGKAAKDGTLYLIQCKRYAGYISRQDVLDLERIARRKKAAGLFIHTGKAGQFSSEELQHVTIIGGERLYSLIIRTKQEKECHSH